MQEGKRVGNIAVTASNITASCKMIANYKGSIFAPHRSAVISISNRSLY